MYLVVLKLKTDHHKSMDSDISILLIAKAIIFVVVFILRASRSSRAERGSGYLFALIAGLVIIGLSNSDIIGYEPLVAGGVAIFGAILLLLSFKGFLKKVKEYNPSHSAAKYPYTGMAFILGLHLFGFYQGLNAMLYRTLLDIPFFMMPS